MAEAACPICQRWFTPSSSRHRYCSTACRKTAWERAHTVAPSGPTHAPAGPGEPGDVYACALCRRRTSVRAAVRGVEPGSPGSASAGPARNCGGPVAIRDLLEEVMPPQA